MKMLNATLLIALTLTSGAAFAERGSGDDNRISYSESAPAQQDSEKHHYSFSNLKHRNRSSGAAIAERGSGNNNRISYPASAPAQQDNEKHYYSFSNLKHRNRNR